MTTPIKTAFVYNKAQMKDDKLQQAQWNHLCQRRKWAESQERQMANLTGNQAALLPRDAYRELDEMTQRVFRHDEGETYMMDLMPLARSTHIGKTLLQYRVSSDVTNAVTRSMGGRVPEDLDKVIYQFEGDPIGIFATGTVREWREQESFASETFDAMADDLEARTANLKQDIAQYMLNGDTRFRVDNFVGQGIRNHRNTKQIELGASGANIDLTSISTTNDQIIQFWVQTFGQVLDDNFIKAPVNIYVSPEMHRRWEQPYANSQGFQGGTVKDYILRLSRVGQIKRTYELTGNNFFGFVPSPMYIRPLVGMAMGTFQVPRDNPFANHQILQWGAYGMQVKEDFNQRAGVFNGTAS